MTALQPVERCLILDQSCLVRATQPESIAAMVGFVPDEDIPRCPALDAIVAGTHRCSTAVTNSLTVPHAAGLEE